MKTCRFITFSSIFGLLLAISSIATADIKTGLVAYYPFNGNANDASGNGNNGTVYGATLTTDRFGNPNSAYSFSGNQDYIKASANGLPTGQRTVALWFYANTVDNQPALLGYGGGSQCGTSWFMNINNPDGPGSFSLQSHCEVNRLDYLYSHQPVGAWYHYAATTDVNGTKLYVNGELKASNSNYANNTVVNGADLAIGSAVSPQGAAPYVDWALHYFDGKIDEVRIYNRALSTSEIQQLYQEGVTNYLDVTAIPDVNGDGVMDQSVLVMKSGNYYLRTIDSATGKQLKQVSLGTTTDITPSALTAVGNQISVLITKSNGISVLQLRNNATLALIKTLTLPK